MNSIETAFPALRFSADASTIQEYQNTTFAHSNKVLGIIYPTSTQEVSEVVSYCQQQNIKIYPISKGRNWGFGSKAPVSEQALVLDLGLMNEVSNLDLTFGTVSIQPGVTFEQLCETVYAQTDDYVVNIIGGSPKASVIGNILERGDGTSTYADRTEYMANIEVVLPDGRIIHTGHGDFADAKTKNIFKHGLGPNLDQLFVQSNLGIVTRISLWLQPKYPLVETFSLAIADQQATAQLVDKLRYLRMTSTINASVALWNDYRSISTLVQVGHYETVVTREDLKKITGNAELVHWFGAFSVHSISEDIAVATRKYIFNAIQDCCQEVVVISRNNTAKQTSFHNLKGKEKNPTVFGKMEALSSVLNGNPSYQSQRSCYWRKKTEVPEDLNPDRDRCGILWAGVTVPSDSGSFDEVASIMEQTITEYGFEPHLTLLFPTDRVFYSLAMLTYDRDKPGADRAAQECHDKILELCMNKGYYPYRLGIQSMTAVNDLNSNYAALIQQLKQSLDANNILAPGRYDFRNLWQ